MNIRIVTTLSELDGYLQEWSELAQSSAEPNPFYSPVMLRAALRILISSDWQIVLVLDSASGRSEMIGFFPIERHSSARRFGLSHYRMLSYEHCFLCTPLMRRNRESDALEAFLNWFEVENEGRFIELQQVGSQGALTASLSSDVRRRNCTVLPMSSVGSAFQ